MIRRSARQRAQAMAQAQAGAQAHAGAAGQPPHISLQDVKNVVNDVITSNAAVRQMDTYDGRISADCIDFIDNWVDTTICKGWDDAQRYRNFIESLRGAAKRWYKLYVKNAQHPPADWDELRQAFLDYHTPEDRVDALREQLAKRKQSPNEDVITYITDKRLLCLDVDLNMNFANMKRHIIKGMLPEIKRVILHKSVNNMAELEQNAKNIEKSIREGGEDNEKQRDEEISELREMFKEFMSHKKSKASERRGDYENNDRKYDRHGRQLYRKGTQERYSNLSRSSSIESGRSLSVEREYRPQRHRPDSRERYRQEFNRPKSYRIYESSNYHKNR